MQDRGVKRLKALFDFYKVSFLRNSFFYGVSLNKSPGIFDKDKFISDPWAGNPDVGRQILNCSYIPDDENIPLDILELFSNRHWNKSKYAASFVWLRDLQSLGGNNSRKYTRTLISTFIGNYRKTKRFWLNDVTWNCGVVGERIVNWIFSYSFYASGSNDRFQRDVLSSINEQFSHLVKCYKAEQNPYSKLMALKAVLFCYSVMRTDQSRRIAGAIKDICKLLRNCLPDAMFENRSPVDTFQVFRSLLEVRFIAKITGVTLPDDTFGELLSKVAANIRYLRLGNGEISSHSGNAIKVNSYFKPSCRMIDTALSIVDIRDRATSINDFERVSTKKVTAIINTSVRGVKSAFNNPAESGINIFDFEASFGLEKLINRSDVSVVLDGFRVKLGSAADVYFEKQAKDKSLAFEGESIFLNKAFKFALRRELEVASDKVQLKGTDYVFLSKKNESYFRFVFNKTVELSQINPKSILISYMKSEYIMTLLSSDITAISLTSASDFSYPSIDILAVSDGSKEVKLSWSIDAVNL